MTDLGSDHGNYLILNTKWLNYGAYRGLRVIFLGMKKGVLRRRTRKGGGCTELVGRRAAPPEPADRSGLFGVGQPPHR